MDDEKTNPRRTRTIVGLSIAAALVVSVISNLAWASAHAESAGPKDQVQSSLTELVNDDGFPGALAAVTSANGKTRDYVAGVAELGTTKKVPKNGEVRIASNTKMFTATVVLQLVDEGLVDLDAPIDTYLPGLVRGVDYSGTDITVRQLLNHSSGLPDYLATVLTDMWATVDLYISPRDALDHALAQPLAFPTGTSVGYSNTNFLIAGLIIEAVTDRPIGEQLTERIIEPLGLEHTYFPNPGERSFRGEHPHAYHSIEDGSLKDITNIDPSLGWAAGQLISTPRDVNAFMIALVDGDLISAASLAEMQTTIPIPDEFWAGEQYGLGLVSYPLSCGGVVWGHGGDIQGFETRNAVSEDGRAVTIAVTALPSALDTDPAKMIEKAVHVNEALDAAFCG